MRNSSACLALFIGFVGAGPSAFAQQAAMLIVPGQSIGPINATSTEADLAATLPLGQVKRLLHSMGEGFFVCATEIYAGTPNSVIVHWSNAQEQVEGEQEAMWADCLAKRDLVQPSSLTIELPQAGSRLWQTADGIGVGMTLNELATVLGQPVTFSVCPCDAGGFIADNSGKLPSAIRLWAEYPTGIDQTLASVVDEAADYTLLSSDVPEDMAGEVMVNRLIMQIGDSSELW